SSAGMLESNRNHREYSIFQEQFNHRKTWTTADTDYPTGDILVSDGTDYYSVYGLQVNRGASYFDPRRDGYGLLAKTRSADKWSSKWKSNIQLTGKAMTLAGDTIFVAGAPLIFKPGNYEATYEGRYGGVLWAASAADGSKLAEYKLEKLPAWDGMSAAYGRLYISSEDGSIECWYGEKN
ncbi:MAG: hypothetical protein KAR47_20125, partial [Planctomycetes bacterium]|nr:hypothetical protein [Planctomycetota bacterium]